MAVEGTRARPLLALDADAWRGDGAARAERRADRARRLSGSAAARQASPHTSRRPARQSGRAMPKAASSEAQSRRELSGPRARASGSRRSGCRSRPAGRPASSMIAAGEAGPGHVGRAREVVRARPRPRPPARRAIRRQASAMAAAGVGPPTWSSTTRSSGRSRPSRSIVFTKFAPCAENTQEVRRIDVRPAAPRARPPRPRAWCGHRRQRRGRVVGRERRRARAVEDVVGRDVDEGHALRRPPPAPSAQGASALTSVGGVAPRPRPGRRRSRRRR